MKFVRTFQKFPKIHVKIFAEKNVILYLVYFFPGKKSLIDKIKKKRNKRHIEKNIRWQRGSLWSFYKLMHTEVFFTYIRGAMKLEKSLAKFQTHCGRWWYRHFAWSKAISFLTPFYVHTCTYDNTWRTQYT